MKRAAIIALWGSLVFGQVIPVPTVPGPYTSCLPAGVTGPQLPICLKRSSGGGVVGPLVGVGAGVVATWMFAKVVRKHGWKRFTKGER